MKLPKLAILGQSRQIMRRLQPGKKSEGNHELPQNSESWTSIKTGTPESVLKFILDFCMDGRNKRNPNLLTNFLLTYTLFWTTEELCKNLLAYYHNMSSTNGTVSTNLEGFDCRLRNRKQVLLFVDAWYRLEGSMLFSKSGVNDFLTTLIITLKYDCDLYKSLRGTYSEMEELFAAQRKHVEDTFGSRTHMVSSTSGLSARSVKGGGELRRTPLLFGSGNVIAVNNRDDSSSSSMFSDTCLSLLSFDTGSAEKLPDPIQEQMNRANFLELSLEILENSSAEALAYHMTEYDWKLYLNLHEDDFLREIFGCRTAKTTANESSNVNVELFLSRHRQTAGWVVAVLTTTEDLNRRVALLAQLIELCRILARRQQINGFVSVMAGLSHHSVTRMGTTWKKLEPNLSAKFAEMEQTRQKLNRWRDYYYDQTAPIMPSIFLIVQELKHLHSTTSIFVDEQHQIVDFETLNKITDVFRMLRYCKSEDMLSDYPVPDMSRDFAYGLQDFVCELTQMNVFHLGQPTLVLISTVHSAIKQRSSVKAGTASDVLEYMLDFCMDSDFESEAEYSGLPYDYVVEDFFLTYTTFMTTSELCHTLLTLYHGNNGLRRKHVVMCVCCWYSVEGEKLFRKDDVFQFLNTLLTSLKYDCGQHEDLKEDLEEMERIMETGKNCYDEMIVAKELARILTFSEASILKHVDDPILSWDESSVRVYKEDASAYTDVRVSADTTVSDILRLAAKMLPVLDFADAVLVEVDSAADYYYIFDENEMSVQTKLGRGGRLFCCPKANRYRKKTLSEPQILVSPNLSSWQQLQMIKAKELAYHLTTYDWMLFSNLSENELLHDVLGRKHGITSNLDRMQSRFADVSAWVATQIVLTESADRRGYLLKKFIKIAKYCKDYNNLHGMAAVISGVTSSDVMSQLIRTLKRLPKKYVDMYREMDKLVDSGNADCYRDYFDTLEPPIIPYMTFLKEDLSAAYRSSNTYTDDFCQAINFEKMHNLSNLLRIVRFCKSDDMLVEVPPCPKDHNHDVAAFVRNLQFISDQRTLRRHTQAVARDRKQSQFE